MTMKPTLQLKLSQHLTLTPQLQQSIRLLQLSTLELNAEVERLLQENPLLEKADEEESSGPPRDFLATVTPAPADKPGDGSDERAPEASDLVVGGDGDWGSPSGVSEDDDVICLPLSAATNAML